MLDPGARVMEVRVPEVVRTHAVPIGSLFVLVHPAKGNAICLRATFDESSVAEEDHRVVPLHWPGELSSIGVPIYLSALNGDAVVLVGARLEVNPLSAALASGSLSAVYCREGRLFFPLNDKGTIGAFADLASGEIQHGTGGHFVAFEEWYVTLEDDWLNRELILPVEPPEGLK